MLESNIDFAIKTESDNEKKLILIKQYLRKDNFNENINMLESNLIDILKNVDKEFDILFDDDFKKLFRESKEIFK